MDARTVKCSTNSGIVDRVRVVLPVHTVIALSESQVLGNPGSGDVTIKTHCMKDTKPYLVIFCHTYYHRGIKVILYLHFNLPTLMRLGEII